MFKIYRAAIYLPWMEHICLNISYLGRIYDCQIYWIWVGYIRQIHCTKKSHLNWESICLKVPADKVEPLLKHWVLSRPGFRLTKSFYKNIKIAETWTLFENCLNIVWKLFEHCLKMTWSWHGKLENCRVIEHNTEDKYEDSSLPQTSRALHLAVASLKNGDCQLCPAESKNSDQISNPTKECE